MPYSILPSNLWNLWNFHKQPCCKRGKNLRPHFKRQNSWMGDIDCHPSQNIALRNLYRASAKWCYCTVVEITLGYLTHCFQTSQLLWASWHCIYLQHSLPLLGIYMALWWCIKVPHLCWPKANHQTRCLRKLQSQIPDITFCSACPYKSCAFLHSNFDMNSTLETDGHCSMQSRLISHWLHLYLPVQTGWKYCKLSPVILPSIAI